MSDYVGTLIRIDRIKKGLASLGPGHALNSDMSFLLSHIELLDKEIKFLKDVIKLKL